MKQSKSFPTLPQNEDIPFFKNQDISDSFIRFKPLTDNQAIAMHYNADPEVRVLGLFGSAGTGKTALALNMALSDFIDDKCYQVKFIRNAVSTRQIGALPGDESEKDAPYLQVVKNLTNEMFSIPGAYAVLSSDKNGTIKAGCSTFIQGETWNDCRVVVDEPQNMNWPELYMIMTRMGRNCKLYLSGDTRQCMLNGKHDFGALPELIHVLNMMQSARIVNFEIKDMVRDDVVAEFLTAVEKMSAMIDRDPEYMDD